MRDVSKRRAFGFVKFFMDYYSIKIVRLNTNCKNIKILSSYKIFPMYTIKKGKDNFRFAK